MKKEDTFYERQRKRGLGLPNDDLKNFLSLRKAINSMIKKVYAK